MLELDKKINHLSQEINFKMEIKASYIIWTFNKQGCNRQVTDFYRFCNNFCTVWERYFNRIFPLVNEFKKEGSTRKGYAEILSTQYTNYLESLNSLEVPAFMALHFNLFLDSVSARLGYFSSYSGGMAHEMVNFPDEQEYRFWFRLYTENKKIGGWLEDTGIKGILTEA